MTIIFEPEFPCRLNQNSRTLTVAKTEVLLVRGIHAKEVLQKQKYKKQKTELDTMIALCNKKILSFLTTFALLAASPGTSGRDWSPLPHSFYLRRATLEESCSLTFPDDFEDVDIVVAYTKRARDYLAHALCGTCDDEATTVYMKRYIYQRFQETNHALREACVPKQFRIVLTREWPAALVEEPVTVSRQIDPTSSGLADETALSESAIGEKFANRTESIFTEEDLDNYGADALALFYLHSDGYEDGGLYDENSLLVPLLMKIPCGWRSTAFEEAAQIVHTAPWYVLPHTAGLYLVRIVQCSTH